jgi:hypothetical protein
MKKQVIYIFLLVILAMPFGVNAQDFNFGLQFGIVPSQVDGDGMTGYNKIGLTAGCFVTRDITKDVFLYTDLSFTMKGSKVASSKNVNFDQLEISANYIDWGIYAGYRFTDKINLKAGLIPSVLIYSNEKTRQRIFLCRVVCSGLFVCGFCTEVIGSCSPACCLHIVFGNLG